MRMMIPIAGLFLFVTLVTGELEPGFRPPAVPIAVWDPYMSIWSQSTALTDSLTSHWGGAVMNIAGIILIDSKPYFFMGFDTFSSGPRVPVMTQTNLLVYPTQTIYTFSQDGIQLTLTFTTPSLVSDIDLWSKPVTYFTYDVVSVDGKTHNVSILYENTGEVAVNDVNEEVEWSRNATKIDGLTVMRIGTTAQNIIGMTGDAVRINWGYFYVVVPQQQTGIQTSMTDWKSIGIAFTTGKSLPPDSATNSRKCGDQWPVLAVSFLLGNVGNNKISSKLMIAYDDIKSMRYFGKDLVPYWRRDGNTPEKMLAQMFSSYQQVVTQCTNFDTQLVKEMTSVGGSKYATLNSLAYRQVAGACKIAYNDDRKTPWIFMKEISSDGDVSTIDVIYPASPMFFYLNPDALRLMLLPLLAYSQNETSMPYNLVWAPHHLGTWPVCDLSPQNQEQMPVEETGNMLMMLTLLAVDLKQVDFLENYWGLLKIWADFLTTNLPDPPKQLCTDDFEGASAHNINLAAKGIVGLASYAKLLRLHNDPNNAQKYEALVTQYTQYWLTKAKDGNHYLREYDIPGSWSLKYNLAFQKYLGLTVFPDSVFQEESAFYVSKLNHYGTPLDERKTFTLLEYMGAIQAVLTTEEQSQALIESTYNWANETPDRVPLTDWYDTVSGRVVGFRARSTVGNLFTKMLLSPLKK